MNKRLHDGQLLGSLLDLQHAVEAGVAHHLHVGDADVGEQMLTLLVLDKEAGEAFQHVGIVAAIPAEEDLVGAEDARHTVGRYAAVAEYVEIVIPELILDEERHHRSHRAQKAPCVADRVKREIANDVGSLIVFAHLIARRREEGEQDLVLGMLLADALHQRASLLELSKRGGMNPNVFGIGIYLLAEDVEGLVLPPPHLSHLFVEETGDDHSQEVDINSKLIHKWWFDAFVWDANLFLVFG